VELPSPAGGGGPAGTGPGRSPDATSGAPKTSSAVADASPGAVTVPLPVITGAVAPYGSELPRRRSIRKGEERRRVPLIVIVCALGLLVLVGRGIAGAASGRITGTAPSNLAGTEKAPVADEGSAGRSDVSATVRSALSAGAASTLGATPPPGDDRVTLALASPSTTAATSPSNSTPPGPRNTTSPKPGDSTPAVTKPAVRGSPIVGVQSGKCIDVAGGSTADFTRVDLLTCNGGAAQAISYTAAGELRVLGKCLDALNRSTASGTAIILYSCNGQSNQKWNLGPAGTIRGAQSNLCLDATAQSTADGTMLELWFCNGGANQAWTR
jgi:hypothetical protein